MTSQREIRHIYLQRTLLNQLTKISGYFLQLRETLGHQSKDSRLHQVQCGAVLAKSLANLPFNEQLSAETDKLYTEITEQSIDLSRPDSHVLQLYKMHYLIAYSQVKNSTKEKTRRIVLSYIEDFSRSVLNGNIKLPTTTKYRGNPPRHIYLYLLLITQLRLTLDEKKGLDKLEQYFTNFSHRKNTDNLSKYYRISGFLAALPSPQRDISKDIILQYLFRINKLRSALNNSPWSFLQQLYIFSYFLYDQTILNFSESLLYKLAEKYNQENRFTHLPSVLSDSLNLAEIIQLHLNRKDVPPRTFQDNPDKYDFSWAQTSQAAEITAGRLIPPDSAEKIFQHTTYIAGKIRPGTLFIAPDKNWSKKYKNRTYNLDKLHRLGAEAVITSKQPATQPKNQQIIVVGNSFSAMLKLATANRQAYTGKVIGITGSVGKTSTATMLHHALSHFGQAYKNIPSFNHQTGIPKTVANIPQKSEFAVIEMGMGYPMSILPKTLLVQPRIAIVVEIQPDHMEFHDSIHSVIQTKMEIIEGLEPGGTIILNRDSAHFSAMLGIAMSKSNSKIVTFGEHPLADVRALSISLQPGYSHLEVDVLGDLIKYKLSLPGAHMAFNSLAVWAALSQLNVDLKKAAHAFESFQPASGRNEIFEVTMHEKKTIKVINDSFNANPSSMRSSFHLLSLVEPRRNGRRIMLMGDMGELGKESRKYHEELAEDINKSKIDIVLSTGKHAENLNKKISEKIIHHHYHSAQDLHCALLETLQDGDVLAIKGSAREKQMDAIIKHLRSLAANT